MSGERLCDMRVWLTNQNQQLARMCCVCVCERDLWVLRVSLFCSSMFHIYKMDVHRTSRRISIGD